MANRTGRIMNAAMSLLFLYAAAVQYNDPDPIRWAVTYALAALFSLAAAFGRAIPILPALLGAVAAVWSASLAVRVIGKQSLIESEEGREMLGLFLVFLWMMMLTLLARSRRRGGWKPDSGTKAQ